MSMRLVAVVPGVPEYADVGPFAATVEPHPWLYCDPCGHRLWRGTTETGAVIFCCSPCKRICDVRRVP